MTGTAVENAINSSSDAVDWPEFMSRHDMLWDTITADPVEPAYDAGLWGGYYGRCDNGQRPPGRLRRAT